MADITINPNTSFQTFKNWQATAQAGQEYNLPGGTVEYPSTSYSLYKTNLLNAMLDCGINSLRVEISLSDENNTGYNPDVTLLAVNDNADPNILNLAGFNFERMTRAMDDIGIPYKTLLFNSTNEPLDISLCAVDFRETGFQAENTPSEYGEFIFAFVQKFYQTYNFLPNTIEAILEPDTPNNTSWTAARLADCIVSANTRLVNAGYNGIKWVVPSTTNWSLAISYYDAMVTQNPSVAALIETISYHRYVPMDDSQASTIASQSQSRGKSTAMLEWIGADYNTLYSDIVAGSNVSWQQYTIAFPYQNPPDSGDFYFEINTSTWVATPASRTKLLRQFMKFIRRDAVRKGVTNSDSNFLGAPFLNPSNTYVVPIKCLTNGSINVIGLPAGTYGIKYSTSGSYNIDLSNQTIATGQNVSFTMPSAGMATVYDVNYLTSAPVIFKPRGGFFACT